MAQTGGPPLWQNFVAGLLSGCGATAVVQPLDLVKTRMQLATNNRSFLGTFLDVIKREGPLGLYTGMSAAMLRQITYGSSRFGLYLSFINLATDPGPPRQPPSFAVKLICGMGAGGIGAFIGNPAEVALVRMTADGRLPPAERRGYKNALDALVRVTKEEGLFVLWRGSIPTVGRAMALNAAQLATFSQTKEYLIQQNIMANGVPCDFAASLVSGLVATSVSLPLDLTKTRLQNMKVVNGVGEYKGFVDCATRTVQKEGLTALWRGFLPFYFKLGPHTTISLIILEQVNDFFRKRNASNA